MRIQIPPRWRVPDAAVTPESTWLDRRRFIGGSLALAAGCARREPPPAPARPLAAPRNPRYVAGPITAEGLASRYNNFYEFGTDKEAVWRRVGGFRVQPWSVEVAGLCERTGVFGLEDLLRAMKLEERVYRFRCVEAWAMVVPWIGFPLADLVRWLRPRADARYLRLVSAHRPEQMPGVREQPWFPWPYFEALSLTEATHDLAFVATGIYGHELPGQHGAPLRLVVPWKYGYKSLKSLARLELLPSRPATFWNALAPKEYGFAGNVDPTVPHPRWSQARERQLGTDEMTPTLPYNGYGAEVSRLYPG